MEMFANEVAIAEVYISVDCSSGINGVQENAMTTTRKHEEITRAGSVSGAKDTISSDQPGVDIAGSACHGDFIDETIAIWQKRTTRRLTREDGREIIENMTGFFRILLEWDKAERAAEQAKAIPNLRIVQQAES
jgi:hypothetical protein